MLLAEIGAVGQLDGRDSRLDAGEHRADQLHRRLAAEARADPGFEAGIGRLERHRRYSTLTSGSGKPLKQDAYAVVYAPAFRM